MTPEPGPERGEPRTPVGRGTEHPEAPPRGHGRPLGDERTGAGATGRRVPGVPVRNLLPDDWRTELQARARTAGLAVLRGVLLTLATLAGSIPLFVLTVLSLALIPIGVGLLTTPVVLDLVRWHANYRRLLAAEWCGVRIPVPYAPLPKRLPGGIAGQVRRCLLMLKDRATWRDLAWLPFDVTIGTVLAILTPALLEEGVFGILLAFGLWRPVVDAANGWWFAFIPVGGWGTAFLAGLLGCVWLAVLPMVGSRLVELHFRCAAALLDRGRAAALSRRIDRLTTTRHDAVDTSAAELRRIERDLHDGAQARLVAVGMELGTVEALLEADPATARELLARARQSSAEALTELRDLVRGIHPPVLAERGLGDAIRALALRMPIPVDVHIDASLPARLTDPVESAAYFAVSEALTNAIKHAGADRIAVDVHHVEGMLRIAVTDDGKGGAVIGAGTGLSGVERRLGTFDGILAVTSPRGGPTMITMEIPCA
ncbi:sensor histidine kinase [Streptomyces odontomachi]|uniref:sensor histidine kinase n=1 Tax=Streptomyces odontomachi TaxID=2944940 RepID=UPI002109CEA7|nr:sensor histidine kinase [Streptomyces sp. ODS25]